MPVIGSIVMFDPRHSFKAVPAETITQGESVYIHTDGLIYAVDNGKSDVCHGWALADGVASGAPITIVKYCRMKVDTTQTIGARVYTGAVAGGSAPSTTLSATGLVVGWAVAADEVIVTAPNPPAADG